MGIEDDFEEVLKTAPIVDCHNDFPYNVRVQLHYELHTPGTEFNFNSPLTTHTDLIKMKEGHLGVQFFSCWIETKNDDILYKDFNEPSTIVRDTLEQIDFVKRLCNEYPDSLTLVNTAEDAYNKYIESGGKRISVCLGVEGLHQVDTSLAVVRQYYEMGVRYITLTWNCDNPFACAASTRAAGEPDTGLTKYGEDCVAEMNRLGMMVDLSHVSYQTMLDVLKVTKAPVLFSHSSAFGLTPHERNVRDDVLELVKKNGGVVSVNFFPGFIHKKGTQNATIDDAADHIVYIINKIGWDHVGLGSDFDGMPAGPVGLEDTSKYPDLLKKVWKMTNATKAEMAKLMGMNVLRVWKQAEQVAKELKEMQVVESNWEDRDWIFPGWAQEMPDIYPGSSKLHKNKWTDAKLDNNPVDF